MAFDWNEIVDKVKTESASLHMWLEKSTAVYDEAANKLVIEVPSQLHKKNLNEKYLGDLLAIVKPIFNDSVSISIEIKKTGAQKGEVSPKMSRYPFRLIIRPGIYLTSIPSSSSITSSLAIPTGSRTRQAKPWQRPRDRPITRFSSTAEWGSERPTCCTP